MIRHGGETLSCQCILFYSRHRKIPLSLTTQRIFIPNSGAYRQWSAEAIIRAWWGIGMFNQPSMVVAIAKRPASAAAQRPRRLNSSLAASNRAISSWFRGTHGHLSKVRAALAEFVIRRQTSTTSQNPLISSVQLLAMDETESKTRLPSTTGVQVGTAPLVMLHARLKNRHEHEESSKHVSSAYVFMILAMIRG